MNELDRQRRKVRRESAGRNGVATRPPAPATPATASRPPPVETFTAADLMRMQLPEPRWAVPGVLPEGLALLAGKPKLGKSWMALGLALAVADGGLAFGSVACDAGDVLYLALEDTKRRLQARLDKLLRRQDAAPPPRLTMAVACPRQDQGGLAFVAAWLAEHKAARLVVIDTWAKFKPRQLVRSNEYETDYSHGAELKAAADKEGLAILALTHCRKMGAADPLEEVNGSVGLTGAADAVIVLRRERGQFDAALHVTGRDVEEQELALRWQPDFAAWSIIGHAEAYRVGKERAEVLDLLRRTGQPLKPSELAAASGKGISAAKSLLWRMAADGLLRSDGGAYSATESNPGDPCNRSDRSNRGRAAAVVDEAEPSDRGSNPADVAKKLFPK